LVIDTGLSHGERIIIEGQHRARHGQLVKAITMADYKKRIHQDNRKDSQQSSSTTSAE
jgi:membrane fusion protein (multidrug efflux system)